MGKPALLFLLPLLSLAFAPAPLPKPSLGKDDLKKLQGTWVRVSCIQEGKPPPSASREVRVVFAGDRMTYYIDGEFSIEWAITLDATKEPRTIDCADVGPPRTVRHRGLYRLQGDTLEMCSCNGGDERNRPTDLDGSRPGRWREVFQRQKP